MTRATRLPQRSDRAVCFDLDGVLVDSGPLVAELADGVLRERGVTIGRDELEKFAGPPLRQSFAAVLTSKAGADVAAVATACVDDFRHRYRIRFLETPAFDGVREMLETVRARSPIAVATSKPHEFAVPLLEHLGLARCFSAIAAPRADSPADDKTTVLANALHEVETATGTRLRPLACTMVGDRNHDIVAARAVGIGVIAVTWGIGTREELESASPDAVVDRPGDLAATIEATVRSRHE